MVQGWFTHVKFKANIHIFLPSLIPVQTGKGKKLVFSHEHIHMFLNKMADFPESLQLGSTHCCIIEEFSHLHNAILSK